MNNIDDVVESITSGRLLEYLHNNVELKSSWSRDCGKKLSFLGNKNIEGKSWLIIGVDDDGHLCNYDEGWIKTNEETISNHLNQYLDPTQSAPKIHCVDPVAGKWIIAIEIENPGTVIKWNHKAYTGTGTTISEMNPDEIMELTITLPGLKDYSAQNAESNIIDECVLEFANAIEEKHDSTIFQNISQLNSKDVLNRLRIGNTNASKILFGDTQFRLVVFDDSSEPIKNESRTGLFQLLSKSMLEEIENTLNSLTGTRLSIPQKAVKEGLANAVAHAAYFEASGDVIIELYPNKLVISNLSLPESCFFANKWFSRSHKTVNNLLMETLRLCGAVDELGRGKNLIYSESIKFGNLPPEVIIEEAQRYSRWRLFIYFESLKREHVMLLNRLRQLYKDERKAQIANALVLWRDKKVSEIRRYIDGESFPFFEDILKDFSGPVFFFEKEDSLVLRRWARLIIEEGRTSKSFTPPEEESLLTFCYEMCTNYNSGILTVKYFRELANMGNTPSEVTLSSNVLTRWESSGILEKLKKGTYRFTRAPEAESIEQNLNVLKARLFK